MANMLVMKRRGQKYKVELGPRRKGTFIPSIYNMEVNVENYKDLALFFSDLKVMAGAPVDKAIKEYLNQKEDPNTSSFW